MDSPRSSRRDSIASHASAAYSQAGSTRHILADMHGASSSGDFSNDRSLYPPVGANPSPASATPSREVSPSPNVPMLGSVGLAAGTGGDASSVSLSVNYLPHKFSTTLLAPSSLRKRKGKGALDLPVPKRGGGVEAFRSGEARMPGAGDEDYDGVGFGGTGTGKGRKMRWNRFKWALFVANFILTLYSLCALIFCLLNWFNVFTHSDIIRVGNHPELVLSTIAASLGIFTCLLGWSGILLNNRAFLAWFTFLLWITLAFLVAPGYVTYKKRTFNLEGKINAQWSRNLGAEGRLRIQNQLECCGYFSPYVEATISQTCYSRSILPGCKLPYMVFERDVLRKWYTVAFSLVPFHIGIILTGLLCSNHVTYRFGKGMMPEAYRLNVGSMAVIMDNYATQLAEQYGNDVASEIVNRSRSNLNLNSMQTMPYQQTGSPMGGDRYHAKYDSVGGKAPEGAM